MFCSKWGWVPSERYVAPGESIGRDLLTTLTGGFNFGAIYVPCPPTLEWKRQESERLVNA